MKRNVTFIGFASIIIVAIIVYALFLFKQSSPVLVLDQQPVQKELSDSVTTQPDNDSMSDTDTHIHVDKKSPKPHKVKSPHTVHTNHTATTWPFDISISKVQGRIDIRYPNQDWQRAKKGDLLLPKSLVRTSSNAQAMISASHFYTVTLEQGSEIQFGNEPVNVTIRKGSINTYLQKSLPAKYKNGITISNAQGTITSQMVEPGGMRVITDSNGNVTAIALSGEIKFFAHGHTLILQQGQLSSSGPQQQTPIKPIAKSKDLLCDINWPKKNNTNQSHIPLSGKALPGTKITMGNKIIIVGPSQSFKASLPVKEGKNIVPITIKDPFGNVKRATSPTIIRDTKRPTGQIHTSPNMWDEKKTD